MVWATSGVSDTGRERVVGPDGDDTGFGHALAGGGDLDGDGTPDLAIHAPRVGHLYVSRAFPTLEVLDTETSTVRDRTVLSLAY